MKKLVFVFIIICLLLQGCADMNSGKRPSDYENTKWVSQNPNIYFEVSDDFSETTGTNTYGKITVGEMSTEITVLFDYGNGVIFRELSSGTGSQILEGTCTFSNDKLIVKVDNYEEAWFDSIDEITFIKHPLDNI